MVEAVPTDNPKRLDLNLCIGGPLDRQQVSVASMGKAGDDIVEFDFTVINFGSHRYHRRDLAAENMVFGVWVYDRMSPDEAMQALLESYTAGRTE